MAYSAPNNIGQYFSDLVFQEPDLRSERDARTIRVLNKILLICVSLQAAWVIVYAFNGFWLGIVINAASISLMLLTLRLLKRKRIQLGLHLIFWVALITIWLIVICFDGPATPIPRFAQFWFILLAAAGYMAGGLRNGGWRDAYAAICGISFFIVHFDFFQLEVVFPLDQSIRYFANLVMLLVVMILILFLSWVFVSDIHAGEARLDKANARLEELLKNMLPDSVAQRLKNEGKTFADGFSEVSILFADIVGFSEFADRNAPDVVVNKLDRIFSRFDQLSEKHGLEKIKTFGGMYMVVAGVPESRQNHAEVMAHFALEMLQVSAEFPELVIRIGINSGPVVAGVIGTSRLIYDLWGDSVNLAQRMQFHGVPGAIQVSEYTCNLLSGKFSLRSRGKINIKGKGEMNVYLLLGKHTQGDQLSVVTNV